MTERVMPVSMLRVVTDTPGRTPPWASLTMPEIMPLVVCAAADVARDSSASTRAPRETSRDITPPLISPPGPPPRRDRRSAAPGLRTLETREQFECVVALDRAEVGRREFVVG